MREPSVREIIGWDIRNWSRALPFWEKILEEKTDLICLELGAGKGGLSLWLASLPKTRHVFCSDKENTEEKVSFLLKRFPQYASKITCLDIDILLFQENQKYDVIICKSVLGISNRVLGKNGIKEFLDKVYHALRPGGIFLFAENLKGSKMHQKLRKHCVEWSSRWTYPSLKELRTVFEIFSRYEIQTHGFVATLGRTEWQRLWLSYVDDILCPLIPHEWKYLGYGYAVK